ncbi:hypothetical protein AWRI1631_42250 [Saccharomyces cerevisiae AWRI1631]|uniref:Uncharacterized protein n=1 Tax=Saccharomyces cerevisiae (strain AWRI1631) TaxID=545124 RepID=B5VFQ4_YEAS6|nr:hypothetical protein AWRI1631_42250 [Saccharomyces cerevisiae AWRI1631]
MVSTCCLPIGLSVFCLIGSSKSTNSSATPSSIISSLLLETISTNFWT